MKFHGKGLALALLQLLLVTSLGGKLLYDRATRPRVWVKTMNYGPDLPVRGRYLTLTAHARPEGIPEAPSQALAVATFVSLRAENGQLVASPSSRDTGVTVMNWPVRPGQRASDGTIALAPPIDFYLPEHASSPGWLHPGEELWAEVTVPKKGPPRPIRLGIKKDDKITPLNLN